MNAFVQYIPAFVDSREPPPRFEFELLDELLGHEIVKRYTSDGFDHFCLSDNHLMAIYDDGFKHWVVGSIKNISNLDLPKWRGWKHLIEVDGEEVVLTDEVVSVCGNQAGLRDGRKGRILDYKKLLAPVPRRQETL